MSSSDRPTPTPAPAPVAIDAGWRGPWARVGRRGLALDVAIAVVLTGLLIANGMLFLQIGVPDLPLPTTITFVSGAVTCLAVALRRVYPLTVFVVVSIAFTVYAFNQGYDAMASSIALFLATVAAGSHGRSGVRDWLRGVVIAALFGTIFYAFDGGFPALNVLFGQIYSLVLNVFYFGAAWVLGDQIRLRHQREADLARRTAELSTRTLELEAERERSAEQAAVAERLRIARELHDVLGHHVSVMGVQAGAARRVLDRDPGRAAEALTAIEGSSRQAITELQRVLKLLRDHEPDHDVEPGRGPLGALGRLEDLADEIRRAGLSVTLQVGDLPRIPTDVDLAAVRVVQESLTNSLRHAGPGSSVWIKVRVVAGAIDLEVGDDGRGTPLVDHREDDGKGTSHGTGVRGMRERVELHGGTFAAGRTPPRGWRVMARIPLAADGSSAVDEQVPSVPARQPAVPDVHGVPAVPAGEVAP